MTKDPVFEDAAREWLEQIRDRVRLSTYTQYRLKLEKNILPYFTGVRLGEISAASVREFYGKLLEDGVNENYAVHILAQLRMMLRSLYPACGLPNPLGEFALPRNSRTPARREDFREADCYDALYRSLTEQPTLTKAGILLTLTIGLRIGELCALKWSDIDLEEGTLTVKRSLQRVSGGGGSRLVFYAPQSSAGERVIPLTPYLRSFLEPFRKEGSLFFLSGSQTPVEPRTMQYRLRAFLKREGLPDLSFSELRKLFANRCVSRGVDLVTLTDLLGNATVQSTCAYFPRSTMDAKVAAVGLAAGGEE